jgi:3-hydroxyacyl-[acyl-carrier-protein] dehydratase
MEHYEASFSLVADEPVFAGHFPGNPLFPGVLTLALMRETVCRATGHAWLLAAVSRHKLMRPLVPGDRVTVQCRLADSQPGALSVDCTVALADGTRAASARLRLEPDAEST